jgi:hypothetical protein
MWEEQESGSRAAEESGSLLCSSHIMMSYCVSITEQTTVKSYLFVLYNKKKTPEQVNSLLFIQPNIWKLKDL